MRYDDGNYKYIFSFNKDSGILDKLSIEMKIEKGYEKAK